MSKPAQSWTQTRHARGQTLIDAVREQLQVSNRQAKARIDARDVFVNGKRVWMARHVLSPGDRIEVIERAEAPSAVLPEVLHRDPWLLAVNKTPGRMSDGGRDSLEALLREAEALPSLRALHRLDKDTSGVLLFNLREEDRAPYVELFRRQLLEKRYLALARGEPEAARFDIDSRLDGKEALTRVRVLARSRGYCLLSCEIPTGRTHQIRRHLAQRRLTIAGDRTYGLRESPPELERGVPRQLLHALELTLPCPHTGKRIHLHAAPPEDFRLWCRKLGLHLP